MIYGTSYEEQCYDFEGDRTERTGAEVVEDPGISMKSWYTHVCHLIFPSEVQI